MKKMEEKITEEQKKTVNSNRVILVEDLFVEDILDKLTSEAFLDDRWRDEVLAKETRRDQVSYLLDKVLIVSSGNYCVFRDSLKEWYPHLHNLLLPEAERDPKHVPMTEQHKARIDQCTLDITELLSVDLIIDYLKGEKVLSGAMTDHLMKQNQTRSERAREFTRRIVTRGDIAFEKFLTSLKQCNDPDNRHLELWEKITEEKIQTLERHKLMKTEEFKNYCQRRKDYKKDKLKQKHKHFKFYPNLYLTVPGVKETIRRKIEKPGDIFDMFDKHVDEKGINDPKRLVLRGPAGIGKTTLMEKVESDWLHGKLWSDKFVAIFSLKIRDHLQSLGMQRDLCSLLLKFNGPPVEGDEEKKKIMDSICKNAHKILIILDGLDEGKQVIDKIEEGGVGVNDVYEPVSFENLVYSLAIKDLLPNAHVIFTTRPLAVQTKNSMLSGICVDVEGFDKEKIKKYIEFYAEQCHKGDTKKRDRFIKGVNEMKKRQPVADSLCYYPLFCYYICQLERIGKRKDNYKYTATFSRVVIEILAKFARYGKDRRNQESNATDLCIITEFQDLFINLCKVAKEGVTNKRFVFSEECFRKLGVDKAHVFVDMGLLKENLMPEEEEEEVEEDNKDEESEEEDNSDDDDDDEDDDDETSSKSFAEGGLSSDDEYDGLEDQAPQPFEPRYTKTYEFSHAIFQEFWAACAFAIDTEGSDDQTWIDEVKDVMGTHESNQMVPTFLIGLISDELGREFVKRLADIPPNKHDRRAKLLYDWVLNQLFEAKHLEEGGVKMRLLTLFQESQQCPPKEIWEYICPDGIFILYQIQLNPKELSAVQYFMNKVGKEIPVKKLIFEKNFLSSKSADFISEILKSVPELRCLKVPNNELGKKGLKKICETVKGSECLEKLELCSNKLKDDLTPLVEVLPTLPNLQYLGLAANEITEEGAQKIAKALEDAKKHDKLRHFVKLDLAYNIIVERETVEMLINLSEKGITILRMGMHQKPTPQSPEVSVKAIARTERLRSVVGEELEDLQPVDRVFLLTKRCLSLTMEDQILKIMDFSSLKKIEFQEISVESDIGEFISKIVEKTSNLQTLKLPYNKLTKTSFEKICQSLGNLQHLKTFEVCSNEIMDDVDSLVDVLPSLAKLEYLGMNYNGMSEVGAKKIVSAVANAKHNEKLQNFMKLDIAYNHIVDRHTLTLLDGLGDLRILVLKMGMHRRWGTHK